MSLSPEEMAHYRRHLLLAEVGEAGQARLKAARVLLVGAGGLGSPVGLYLAAAGVGHLGVVDNDLVDHSNLQRQVLYTAADVGQPKAPLAAARLRAGNPHIEVIAHRMRLSAANAEVLAEGYDLLIDGSDNFPTRYLVNDLAVLTGRPLVHGAIFQFDGQVSVFNHDGGPCYRCLYPEPPPAALAPNCAEAGVLGVLPGLVGLIQATEAIKLLLGRGRTLAGRLLTVDALQMRFRELRVARDPGCPACGEAPTIVDLDDTAAACAAAAAQSQWDITPQDFAARQSEAALIDVRSPAEAAADGLGGQLIPLDQLDGGLGALDRGAFTVVHCRSGLRSARAVERMRAAGFTDAWNLRGGLLAWKAEGYPIEVFTSAR